ncbi:hypothetical protein [Mycobacterium phage WXIN]|nr:hypothetical protein [Mycobacterium phage WXIN]
MTLWWVYNGRGDLIDCVDADGVADALNKFTYADAGWFAVPDGFVAMPARSS